MGGRHHLHPDLDGVPVPGRGDGRLEPADRGLGMATHLRTELVLDALDMALWQRRPDEVIHHSDQGKRRGNQKRRLKRSTVHGSGVAPENPRGMSSTPSRPKWARERGSRVFYHRNDLEEWVYGRRLRSTSDARP